MKRLVAAKSRLRDPAGDPVGHTRLALALTLDTVAAARTARRVRTVLVVTADRTVAATLVASGIEVADDPLVGLNAAYDRGARLLRERDPHTAVGALQADLPALRPAELDAAIAAALATGRGRSRPTPRAPARRSSWPRPGWRSTPGSAADRRRATARRGRCRSTGRGRACAATSTHRPT